MSSNDQDIYGHTLKLTGPEQAALSGAAHVCLRKEVQFHTGKKEQLETRVLILTTTRCYLLSSRQHGRTEISQQFHFLRLARIESLAAKQLTFFLNGDNQPKKLNVVIDNDCIEVTAAIVSQLRNVLPSAPKEQLVAMQFEPSNRMEQTKQLLMRLQDAMQPSDMSTCGGFVTTYGFLVDFFSCPFRDEVSWDIDNIYVSHGFKQLNLSHFHHLDSKDLQPIILALRYNLYFDGLVEKNFKLTNESFDTINQVFISNSSLRTLTLDNVGLRSENVMKIATSISANKKTALTHLDLSNNHLDDKGFELLAGALENIPHGLVELSLANSGMSSRAASLLSAGMKKNKHFATSLNKMDWSGNILGPDSMAALAFLQDSNSVVHLNLTNCQLQLEMVLATLRRGCCQHLSYLDLNNNNKPIKKRDNHGLGKLINDFFSKVIAMETILLSNCKLPVEAVTALVKGISSNPNVIKVTMDISSNELGVSNVKELVAALTNFSTLHSIDITDNGLDIQLVGILKALLSNPSLKHLSIGKNFNKTKNPSEILSSLVSLINKDTVKLESLSLADSKLREHTGTLLDGLGLNQCVTKLDVSGNDMGDRGAYSLAKLLLVNNTLHTISWDHNLTGLAGFENVANSLEHNCTMRSMPTPLSDTMRISREAGLEAVVQRIQQILFRNHSPERTVVELASRRNKYAHISSSRQQELDHSLVQLEDLLKMIPKESQAEPSVQRARDVKEEAYKVSQLVFGLYPPKLEAEQASMISEQMKAIARPLQQKLFHEQLQENSERMVSLCDKTCPLIFGEPEAKQSLRELIVTTKDDHFLENELVAAATQSVTTSISGINLTTSSDISECVFEHVLSALDECIEQLVPLKHTDMIDGPQRKPRSMSFRGKQSQKKEKEKEKTKAKSPTSPKGKPEKLPELAVEAPMRNATITKNRVQRPQRIHRVSRPSQVQLTIDITDAPSLSVLEEAAESETSAKSPSPTPMSPVSTSKSPMPLSPTRSPSLKSPSPARSPSLTKSPSPNISTSTENPTVTSEPSVDDEEKKVAEDKEVQETVDKKQDDQTKSVEEKAQVRQSVVMSADKKQDDQTKSVEEKAQLRQSIVMPKEDKKHQKEKEKEDKKLQKEKEKEEKKLQKEKEKEEKKKQKEKEKEEKKQHKNTRRVSKQPGTEEKEFLEASLDKRSSLRKSMELSSSKTAESLQESELPGDPGKKVPPPTKAKPKPPVQEPKKPILPPNAAKASTLANVLVEGRKQAVGDKKAPPSVAKKPVKKAEDDQTDHHEDEGKVEGDKKLPPSVAKKPPKKDQQNDNGEERPVDDEGKMENKKASPPVVAKKPSKKKTDQGDSSPVDGSSPVDQVEELHDEETDGKAEKPSKEGTDQDDSSTDNVDKQHDEDDKGKATPPAVSKEGDSSSTGDQHSKDGKGKGEDEKATPPAVAKKPPSKEEVKQSIDDSKGDEDDDPVINTDDSDGTTNGDKSDDKVETNDDKKVDDKVNNNGMVENEAGDDKGKKDAEVDAKSDEELSIGPSVTMLNDDTTVL